MYRKWCRVYLWLSTLLGSHLFELSGQIVADAEVLIYHLTEQNAPNQVLGNVMVDGGWSNVYTEDELSIMEFDFLSASSDYRDYFNIEDDGTLVAASAVDRDDLCENAEDCVIPLDISMRGGPVFEIIKVHVMVDDINDNDPMFSDSEVGRSISEAAVVGAHIIIPTAQDPDSPQNGIQGYKLQEYSPTFTLLVEEETLALVLEAPLDRETQAFYEIEVIAVDGGNPPKEGHMTVYIEVLDVNDHSPEFDNSTYYTSISENLPPFTTVLRVHAVDYDAGEAGEVQYSLSVGTEEDFGDIFGIDAITGDIYTKVRLDYEDEESYRLKVIAEDQSPDSLPSFANVVVDVIDLNDHSPLIMINTGSADGSVEVSEGAPIGAFVAHITVEDVDGGNNGRFVCSLENTNSFQLQKLHETEFKVISTVPFDREAMAEYLMMIRCADLGTPQQVSTQFLTVHITDENDHEPVFLPNVYEATVMEDIPFDEVILQVTATDQDIGDNGRILYTIDESSEAFFWINSSTGELTAHSLDYESDMFLTITVTATDQANPFWFDTASVLITILDADDNAPQFSSYPFVFRILENQLPGTFVGAVTADDPDSAPFNNFTYSIEPDFNGNGHFLIDPRSGSMYTTMPLDREQTALYHLVVTATGTAGYFLENSTNVFISVIDQNDNVPEVLYPTATNHTVYLASNLSVGYVVSRVFVVDNDTDANGYIRYNISSGNTDNIFTIDQDTGAILLAKSLRDYEELTFSLAITISDSGEPPHVVHVVLDLVVNASATPSSGLMSTHNLSIVISIATISALLIIILIVAIYVLTKKQRENKLKKKYNYAARLAEQKNQQNFEKNNPDVTKDAPNGERGDTEDSLPKKAVLDTRYSKANGMPIWPEPKANYQVNRTPSLNCSSIGVSWCSFLFIFSHLWCCAK